VNGHRRWLAGAVLAASVLGGPASAGSPAGDLTQVTLLQRFDPVSGVRLIEVSGIAVSRTVQVWLMIEDRNFLRLTDCLRRDAGRVRPGLSYSEKSHMVSVVTCG